MSNHDDLALDAKAKANDLKDTARNRLSAEVEAQADAVRDAIAQEAQSAAHAAEAAAHEFDAHSLQAQAAHRLADQIEGAASQLRTTDLNAIVTQTSDFARRNPLLFIGGAAALGFAATRFLKARKPEPAATEDHADPWRSGTSPATTVAAEQSPSGATVTPLTGGTRHG